MVNVLLVFRVLAIILGLLSIVLFAKVNLVILKFRKLTSLGVLALWTGSIDTNKLIIVNGKNSKVVEKELVKAIIWHKRIKYLIYAAIILNILTLIVPNGKL